MVDFKSQLRIYSRKTSKLTLARWQPSLKRWVTLAILTILIRLIALYTSAERKKDWAHKNRVWKSSARYAISLTRSLSLSLARKMKSKHAVKLNFSIERAIELTFRQLSRSIAPWRRRRRSMKIKVVPWWPSQRLLPIIAVHVVN